jgi:hypothetical protein
MARIRAELRRLFETHDFSRRVTAAYLCALIAVVCYALYTNLPCLFFDWDGMAQAVAMDAFQHFNRPFSRAVIDPLQGLFDIPYLGYRGALPQSFVAMALGGDVLGSDVAKIVAHALYDLALTLGVYAVGRAVGFDRKVSFLGSLLFALLMLPLFKEAAVLDNLTAISPFHTYTLAVSTIVVALIWCLDGRSWLRTAAITIAIMLLLLSVAVSLIFMFSMLALTILVMGLASLFADGERRAVAAKLAAGVAVVVAFFAAGIPTYVSDLASSIAQQHFALELEWNGAVPNPSFPAPGPVLSSWVPYILWNQGPTQWIMTLGIPGAVLVVLSTCSRGLKVFAFAYLAAVIVHLVTFIVGYVYWPWLTGESWKGPTLMRMVHYLSPFGILFIAILVPPAARCLLAVARYFWWPRVPSEQRPSTRHAIQTHIMVLTALSGSAALAASNPMEAGQQRCARPYFSPLERNAIVEHLERDIALDVGKTFRGSVATFTGTRRPAQIVWVDNITTDWELWNRTGNEMRTIGLWRYFIPTLQQVNITITPQFFLTVAEFLTERSDKQTRIFMGITKPHETMLPLWGVRYVIADQPLPFGTERLQMPVDLTTPPLYQSPIRLYELRDPNRGDYSPTQVVSAATAKETLAAMRQSDFDGRRMVVTDASLRGDFIPAARTSMTIIHGGFALDAASDGESILVLPAQYSHCWVSSDPSITFFRANMMQLGVRFSGQVSAEIRYAFGPFWNSRCRREDGRDVERLQMVAARPGR